MTILNEVKAGLGITGSYQDDTINQYIVEVKQYLLDGGVAEEVVEAESTKGTIIRGVSDLWNYGSGGTSFSPYFVQRAIQLACKTSDDVEEETEEDTESDSDADE